MKKKIIFILLLNFAFSQLSEKQDSLLKPLKKSSDAFLLQQDNNNIGSMIILDTEKSKFLWKGGLKFAVSNHDGNLLMSNGRISIENNIITGNISIDMKTISNNDLSSGSKERLVGHLKSSDFFYVSKYPKSKLEIKSSKVLEKLDNGKYKMLIEGDITIKNVTNPTTFEAIVDLDSKIKTAEGKLSFDRSKFNVQYRSEMHLNDPNSFWNKFQTSRNAAKDKVIRDIIEIDFYVVSLSEMFTK